MPCLSKTSRGCHNRVFNRASAPAGITYTLTAKATDDKGAVTTSAARTITVEGTAVAGNVYYIHSDHLETPREITNEQNQTVWKNPPLTEPFGITPVDDDPDSDGQTFTFNLRFTGQYYDQETGTHYNYYRDNYLPDFGRYGQSDPIGLVGGINTCIFWGRWVKLILSVCVPAQTEYGSS
jgi:RHS repeat-associated protein